MQQEEHPILLSGVGDTSMRRGTSIRSYQSTDARSDLSLQEPHQEVNNPTGLSQSLPSVPIPILPSETGPDCLRYRVSGEESWLTSNEYGSWRSHPIHWASHPRRRDSHGSLLSRGSALGAPDVGIAEGEGGEDIRDQLSTEFVDETSVVKGRIHRVLRLWPAVLVCVIIWCLPVPDLLSPASMRLLGVFAGVITALLTTEFEISFLIAIALTILTLTRSFACRTADGSWIPCGNCEPNGLDPVRCKGFEGAFDSALLGYSSEVNWLVFCAFHLGQAVQVSGLGRRIALHLVRLFGKSLFGLGYALFLAELCLGPFIPSNAARGGGVMQPIVLSLAHALNSTPTYRPRIGAYLILCAAHANLISASVYLTGSAPNPIAHAKAASILGVDLNFSTWLKGGIVPGLLSLLLVPALLYVVIRPQKDANDIEICQEPVNDAHRPLVSMPASRNATANVVITQQADGQKPMDMREWMLVGILSLCLVLWVTQSYTGITASLVAFMGMVLVLAMGVLEWEDVLRNGKAWDSLFWLGGFLTLAQQFTLLGLSGWFGDHAASFLKPLTPLAATMVIALLYFVSMFGFSSLTAHTVALAGPFFAAAQSLNCPPMIVAALVAYFGGLCGALTNYSTGSLVVYFAQGYVSQSDWFRIGGYVSLLHIAVFLGPGLVWWYLLGWF